METLVETILSLEKEADSLLEEARGRAKEIEEAAKADLVSYQQEMAREVEARVAAYRREAEEKNQAALAQVEAELQSSLEALDRLDESAVQRQVERIVARVRQR